MRALAFILLTALMVSTAVAAENQGIGVLKFRLSDSTQKIDYWVLVDAKTEKRLAKFYDTTPTLLPAGTFKILLGRNNPSAETAVTERVSIKQNSQTNLKVN